MMKLYEYVPSTPNSAPALGIPAVQVTSLRNVTCDLYKIIYIRNQETIRDRKNVERFSMYKISYIMILMQGRPLGKSLLHRTV